jgi:Cu/Ag efflux protein CusF
MNFVCHSGMLSAPCYALSHISKEGLAMKNACRFGFSVLAGTVLVAGALALPPAKTHQTPEGQQAAAQTQSVSGKIASIDQSSFTITVGSGSSIDQDPQKPAAASSTMTFAVDKNTTVEGSMKVGSTADVTYRQDGGTNVAISVRVTP